MHIWHGLNLAAPLLGLSLGSVWENVDRFSYLEWFKSDRSTFGVCLGSVWKSKTVTGAHIWYGLNLAAPLLEISLG